MNGRRKKEGARGLFSPLGSCILFLSVAAIITVALLVYGAAERTYVTAAEGAVCRFGPVRG